MDKNKEIKTKEEAMQYAIEWQQWASEQKMFMSAHVLLCRGAAISAR
jgi:hypothetical protein